jgi:hypothetical protein
MSNKIIQPVPSPYDLSAVKQFAQTNGAIRVVTVSQSSSAAVQSASKPPRRKRTSR